MLEAGGELPQLAAVLRAHERREEIVGQRARGQRRIRIQRLEVRAAQRVGLVDADVEGPVVLPAAALREAEVREQCAGRTRSPAC